MNFGRLTLTYSYTPPLYSNHLDIQRINEMKHFNPQTSTALNPKIHLIVTLSDHYLTRLTTFGKQEETFTRRSHTHRHVDIIWILQLLPYIVSTNIQEFGHICRWCLGFLFTKEKPPREPFDKFEDERERNQMGLLMAFVVLLTEEWRCIVK